MHSFDFALLNVTFKQKLLSMASRAEYNTIYTIAYLYAVTVLFYIIIIIIISLAVLYRTDISSFLLSIRSNGTTRLYKQTAKEK